METGRSMQEHGTQRRAPAPPANDHLPNEILGLVFGRLQCVDRRVRAAVVCRTWRLVALDDGASGGAVAPARGLPVSEARPFMPPSRRPKRATATACVASSRHTRRFATRSTRSPRRRRAPTAWTISCAPWNSVARMANAPSSRPPPMAHRACSPTHSPIPGSTPATRFGP
ncbi:ankyrin repeat protein [Pandoravirus inopinatum]|uniref:Ankyrin repeat protein n=1 Tax=Pandoravirus inopinatum TaxID=1605721 RepID=A0A0B5IY48_9VIRU|nr:ankyrin repeat protein [Pandoravirus inopinatum]AJF97743.1 ankyrin repeat protein [Pandoravirus inopinatum]